MNAVSTNLPKARDPWRSPKIRGEHAPGPREPILLRESVDETHWAGRCDYGPKYIDVSLSCSVLAMTHSERAIVQEYPLCWARRGEESLSMMSAVPPSLRNDTRVVTRMVPVQLPVPVISTSSLLLPISTELFEADGICKTSSTATISDCPQPPT